MSQFGEKVKETNALGNATSFTYDAGGRLIKVTDSLGINTKYAYDKIGKKVYHDGWQKQNNFIQI